ncbi:fumarylacetoacetate hydrolase family protein [Fictibacillus terranigra]|uniref:Fumarylacetoacetate hydrolase family protein n=1 Tax=Fictibacillus terranigra TaxID=3058424 RepID=A0ABT8E1W5_9BACL|nr:fumarylacetoacetate hydrolase family protein [Fictibacillus sp. CENA-BCM004]MDN4071899.1 fumarylacetoacetate hydrolase family protein [Fictibacillus sp. CENA-BCM004]
MRILRYKNKRETIVLAALADDERVYDLPHSDFMELVYASEREGKPTIQYVKDLIAGQEPIEEAFDELQLAVPIAAPEVWASGVTYEKSKDARNYEATAGKLDADTFYDKVYEAERPEIFFKSTAARTIGPGQPVYLRSDSDWQIPEPELGLVLSKSGKVLGYTAGNDMSCRDIEGENPLYLPQAKVWKHSCAIGPVILLAEAVDDPYSFDLACRIYRSDEKVVEGTANTKQLKRRFDELVEFLARDNELFDGTVLLTGTCIVPPNEFTLKEGDRIEIEISSIGVLNNPVKKQESKIPTAH